MKKQNEIFGKFKKSKIGRLASIKGGVLSHDTKTTLCVTTESTFDSDLAYVGENTSDRRCEEA